MSLEGVLGKQHEVEQHSKCPDIHRDAIIRVANDLRSHVFLSPAVGLSSDPANRPREPEIRNLIHNLASFSLLQQDVLRLDVPMYKILLVDASQSLQDFHHHPQSMLEREDLARKASLVGQQVPLVAELEHNEYEVRSVERQFLLNDVPMF